jgi:hypothetical protein
METNHKEILIERYLSDELSLTERQSFESEIQANPELSNEVAFQKLVINGIKKYRVNQLKSQLSTVDVSSVGFGNTGYTVVSSLIILVSIVSGIYYFEVLNKKNLQTETVWINADLFNPNPQKKIEFPVEKVTTISKTIKSDEKATFANKSLSNSIRSERKIRKEEKRNEVIAVVPQIQMSEDIGQFHTADNDDTFPEIMSTEQKSIPSIVLSNDNSKELRYKYTDGHLSLYGDFSLSPYEILEINSANGKQVYLYHLELYYQIELVTEITALIPMSNAKKIEELKLVLKNK